MKSHKKILIVEDDPILLSILADNLAKEGFEIIKAIDGEQGLNLALDEKPDLILLDILLPKIDGLTMLKKLTESEWGKNAPVIILTNLEFEGSISKALESMPGLVGYIIKSEWKIDDVLAEIKRVLISKYPKTQKLSLKTSIIVLAVLLAGGYLLYKNYYIIMDAGAYLAGLLNGLIKSIIR